MALLLCGTVMLAGCGEDKEFPLLKKKPEPEAEVTSAAATPGKTPISERDVEAPEVFEAADSGLWDGRPSLGGVWVAHPDVTGPERVLIRNEDNGKYVVGALFKRERNNPGPSIQVSSDAASALGMLAGAPEQLSVVALRREEAAPGPAELPISEELPESEDSAETEETLLAEAELPGVPAPIAVEPIPASADPLPLSLADAPKPEVAATPVMSADAIETATRDHPMKVEVAALEAAIASPADISNVTYTSAPAEDVPAAMETTPLPPPAVSDNQVDKPFIQIGLYSVEGNAISTADKLRSSGIVPAIVKDESNGKPYWRVLAGPAPTKADRTSLLAKLEDLGYSDAYFVNN
ncbi:SPOR domain-containing protein [Pseudoruegeria sp. HB172150]|uniref:SPOR domain-containing protein n=1 Tax=Pseudoruegeria sp. HB172150 TaxID=2721164 RepID=UPI0020A69DD6|nr:SPOR domain-containing protein [Pseudoruegeria sp. HB172150]